MKRKFGKYKINDNKQTRIMVNGHYDTVLTALAELDYKCIKKITIPNLENGESVLNILKKGNKIYALNDSYWDEVDLNFLYYAMLDDVTIKE